jgi:GcrA cell cycle regulator
MRLAARDTGRKMTEKHWTDHDIEELKKLRSQGLGPTAIGAVMGRSRNSIDHKLRRMNPIPHLIQPRPARKPQIYEVKKSAPTCQWPIGTPKEPGFHFCAEEAKTGKPYCEKHCSKAYVDYRFARG